MCSGCRPDLIQELTQLRLDVIVLMTHVPELPRRWGAALLYDISFFLHGPPMDTCQTTLADRELACAHAALQDS